LICCKTINIKDCRASEQPICLLSLKRLHFDFEDIAKQLAPKKQYKFFKDRNKNLEDYLFNYHLKTTVSGCPVSARFMELFGDKFMDVEYKYKREKDGKSSTIDIDDIWHILFTFHSEEKLIEFVQKRLNFNNEQIKEFLNIHLKQDYASLSLKAIKKILPYLREGLIYSQAVFLANMENVIPSNIWNEEENRKIIREEIHSIIKTQNEEKQIIEIVNGIIKNNKEEETCWSEQASDIFKSELAEKLSNYYGKNNYSVFSEEKTLRIEANAFTLLKKQMQLKMGTGDYAKVQRIDERIKTFIIDNFEVKENSLKKLYHPSAIEVYKPAVKRKDGRLYLNSPMITAIRNPMAMRALHQLRKVINELIKNDVIDATTKVNIEMARDLMNANERKALQNWQRDRENKMKEYSSAIKEHFIEIDSNAEPSNDEVLKYQLWEEQKHKCIYTGDEISISDFLGANPNYDIEHTIPRSLSLDNSQENKTICQNRFNRSIKKNKIPYDLRDIVNYPLILERIEPWKEKYEDIEKQIQQAVRQSKGAVDKTSKDRAIQKRHKLTYERNYWRNKYQRFTMKDVPEGFKNSQLVDTGIITKYARLYMKTIFDKVYTVKGNTVADFRKMWGLQDEYKKKARVNHIHHCIDAITIACITKENYEKLAKFYHEWKEGYVAGIEQKPLVDKPWVTFSEDVKEVENEVLISHYTPDNLPKQSKKKIRIRGKIKRNAEGEPIYQKGDTVRGALHKETNYGAIKKTVLNKKGEEEEKLLYVSRKSIDSLKASDIKNIVDDNIRVIVEEGKKKEVNLKKEFEIVEKQLKVVKTPEEKNDLNNKLEDLRNQLSNLFAIANKDGSFTPIKKVRCVATTVTNPLHIKKNRDLSKYDYKHFSHFANDGNYMMAIYEGKDKKDNTKRDFILVNNLDAGKFFTGNLKDNPIHDIHPKSGLQFKSLLKTGTMVILWENEPDEVWELNVYELKKRIYKIVGLSMQIIQNKYEYGVIVLRHQNEARMSVDLTVQDGIFNVGENHKPLRKLNQNQFNALVEGFDYTITATGKIIRKN